MTRQTTRLTTRFTLAATAVLALASGQALAQNEQFVPANFYWVGPYAPGGSGFGGGSELALEVPVVSHDLAPEGEKDVPNQQTGRIGR